MQVNAPLGPNGYDYCLAGQYDTMTEIVRRGGLVKMCCPVDHGLLSPPWIEQPREGRRLQQLGSIVLPVVEQVDSLVLTYRVPIGYDGVIVSIVNLYTGTGFVEGSGDIIYRIQINRRWLKDYGNIITTLGSLESPCSLGKSGIKVKSNEVINYYVWLGLGSLGNLLPGARIVVALFGWIYPYMGAF